MSVTLNVLSWNVGGRGSTVLGGLSKFSPFQLVTLQEVALNHESDFRQRLEELGLSFFHYSGCREVSHKRFGNVIASCWPLHKVELRYSRKGLPWPQAIAQASVSIGPGADAVSVITAHIPNGVNNGWEKIDTFCALNELARQAKNQPCIVTGDFNEPRYVPLQNGRIVTFGQDCDAKGAYVCWKKWTFRRRTGKGEEWDKAVRSLFEKDEPHGLRHAYWEAHGRGAMTVSHVTRGQPRWFDHVFVSGDFRVARCDYRHEFRDRRFSDHSAVLAQLVFSRQKSGSEN